MSKKNKRKFINNTSQNQRPASPTPAAPASMAATVSAAYTSPETMRTQGVMSAHADEYKIIRWDLIKVAILNLIFLIAVLTLYYTNLHSQYLERWFGNILKF